MKITDPYAHLDPAYVRFENVPGITQESTATMIAESRNPGFRVVTALHRTEDTDPPRTYWRCELWKERS